MQGTVLHVHTGPTWGGGEAQVVSLVRGLLDRGVTTTLLANERGPLAERAMAAGIPTVPLRVSRWARWLPASRTVPNAAWRNTPPPLLLHAHDSLALDLALRIAARAPVVLSRRVASPLRHNPWSCAKYSHPRIAAVVAVSSAVAETLYRSGLDPRRIRVIPSGSDVRALDATHPALDVRALARGRPLVGGVGRLARKKDFQLLLATAHELKRRGLSICWVVVGDGPERGRLQARARRLGLAEDVAFLGFRRDAATVIAALDLLFFPSRVEGSPGAVREAMLLGVPVLARAAAGTMETLREHGLTFSRGTPDETADLVERLLGDRALARRLAAEAREAARRRFDIALTCDATLDVYREILGRRGATGRGARCDRGRED